MSPIYHSGNILPCFEVSYKIMQNFNWYKCAKNIRNKNIVLKFYLQTRSHFTPKSKLSSSNEPPCFSLLPAGAEERPTKQAPEISARKRPGLRAKIRGSWELNPCHWILSRKSSWTFQSMRRTMCARHLDLQVPRCQAAQQSKSY